MVALITGSICFLLFILLIDIVLRRVFHVDARGQIGTFMKYHNYEMDANFDGSSREEQPPLQNKEKRIMIILGICIVVFALITYFLI